MQRVQTILFYSILLLTIISTLNFNFSRVTVFLLIVMILASIYISIKYNIIYTIKERRLWKFKIINIEAFLGIVVLFIGMRNIDIGLEKADLARDFFNFYYLLLFPFYFLSLIRISRKKE